jgi:Subtilase family
MADKRNFDYLKLLRRESGPANLRGGGPQADRRTLDNRIDRTTHSANLRTTTKSVVESRRKISELRKAENLPELTAGIPLLLEVDPALDIDKLRHYFNFEIVSEEDGGFVIVASSDIDLSEFLEAIDGFAEYAKPRTGTATIASVFRLDDDINQTQRLKLILSEYLHSIWGTLDSVPTLTVDIGVTCLGTSEIPKKPENRTRESDEDWARKVRDWAIERIAAYDAWYDLQEARSKEVQRIIVEGYGGAIEQIVHDEGNDAVTLPDSFSMRIRVSGKGLKDFVLNFPFVFEVVEPDTVQLRENQVDSSKGFDENPTPLPPDPLAPAVCVIDSGIQEGHRLIERAIDKATSFCFLPPPASASDVSDYIRPGGHGTRVAGAILYGETVRRDIEYQLPFWIQNARVLDADGFLPSRLFPAALLRQVVDRYHHGPRQTRLFNHSINADCHCRLRHMSAWAAQIDAMSEQLDILVIQSSGNIRRTASLPRAGILDHLGAGRAYPDFLIEPSSRVANPAQSLQALTVGSVAYQYYDSTGWKSFVKNEAEPSSFSRSGLGLWNVIKPEVVEFGGDYLLSPGTPPIVSTPTEGRDCFPELVRSTKFGPGPEFDRDDIGTSYAAPKVTHIAAHLQRVLPDEPCLLYRALIVQSARWPEWTRGTKVDTNLAIRTLGYGLPDPERATTNNDYRVTLITSGEIGISAGECDLYQIPIPESMRRPGYEYDVLIEVTLSYVAKPRRTRRNLRRYLSTWLDWKSSKLGESIESFRLRALKNSAADDKAAKGTTLSWTLGAQVDHGTIEGAKRSSGTVQKDWATVKSNQLPEHFCIAVNGHQGWSKDPDSKAKYALVVSFEIVGREIPIYGDMRVAVDDLQAELQAADLDELDVEL